MMMQDTMPVVLDQTGSGPLETPRISMMKQGKLRGEATW